MQLISNFVKNILAKSNNDLAFTEKVIKAKVTLATSEDEKIFMSEKFQEVEVLKAGMKTKGFSE